MMLFDLFEDILSTENKDDFLIKVTALWQDRKKLQEAFKDYLSDLTMKEQSLRFTFTNITWLTDENEKLKQDIEDIKKDRDTLLDSNKIIESKLNK